MEFVKSINVVDTHTMGEPTRILVGGLPVIPGNTMPEKKKYLEENMDHIRTMLMHEPRGHKDMFGAIITQPTCQEADIGVIFMDGGGYLNMCGHGSIGVSTMLVETGMVEKVEPVTEIVLEAPAGLIKARVEVENGKVKGTSITNVPSFLYKEDLEIEVPNVGKVKLDISFGGSFFALVNAKELGMKVDLENVNELVDIGMAIRDILNRDVNILHPEKPHIKTIDLVEIYDLPSTKGADLKNVVIFGMGQVDRSPCGTGTSAKLATLYAKGKIGIDEPFVYESITGTTFRGRVVKETKIGEYSGIVPEITGRAYITGFNQIVVDPDDPFKDGFLL
ncbi:proline racemase [Anaerosalibacter sp. Marseille-P3206]|uniref:proline racemase n=1 Tax=Anaerosalibacter sp. Marseille-P3206 TaxID=1871005 RepID=UPI0009844215|nr:proline racemase [Anaerosalibacter sp. Marseille-P3206]